ncbi:MAG: acyl-CoA dehydrogenase C-terminal domain-containing protein, partial [Pseudomonadota bacterium]|nr:acyl-CoA dehydrogenase C-terminal domain-containing protein [Pseudomonadota bacterium]
TRGAYRALNVFGCNELKALYLPRLASGEWSGTMCLTEPQCGTDLGLIRTRAEHDDDGNYALRGTKIFISAGEHDLSSNIIHLVLARLPDAPAGIKGISLFLVPKFIPDHNGDPGQRNSVTCASIENKMGIKASATCVMNFDDAKGWLVGEPHKGMQAMFTMMNDARLGVGLQGLGLAEIARQSAVDYARERLQGRSISGTQHEDKPADPIIVHPDVRRMLLTMRAFTEGARAMAVWIARHIDLRDRATDADTRQAAEDMVQLLTPIVKVYFSDGGFEITNLCIQVYGGHGYIRDTGVEQYARDARIAQIYEGANGIQALDLVGRKLPAHMGRYLRRFFHPVQAWIDNNTSQPELHPFVLPLAKAFGRLQIATGQIAQSGLKNPDEAGAASTDYLKLFGLVAFAYLWARMAKIGLDHQTDDEADFYAAKVATAKYFMDKILPQTGALFSSIMAGSGSIMDFPEASF